MIDSFVTIVKKNNKKTTKKKTLKGMEFNETLS